LFRIHFIRVDGTEKRLTVRILLVVIPGAQVVYEGFGSWSKCIRWIERIPGVSIPKGDWAAARKLLDRKQLATIQEVSASLRDLELQENQYLRSSRRNGLADPFGGLIDESYSSLSPRVSDTDVDWEFLRMRRSRDLTEPVPGQRPADPFYKSTKGRSESKFNLGNIPRQDRYCDQSRFGGKTPT